VLAPLVLLARAWGAPLGEPVADDLYFLHRALFGPVGWLDGFGSPLYWRPFGRQAYFLAFGPLILAWPLAVALLHSGLLALATWLIHRTLRRHWPAPIAAAAATFPALAEATRTLIAWPSGFQDLGALVFAALAVHEAGRRRLATTLAALLASLLCKEVAVSAALVLPWLPAIALTRDGALQPARAGPALRARLLWCAAMAGLLVVWGALYELARRQGGVGFQHDPAQAGSMSGTALIIGALAQMWRAVGTAFSLDALPRWLADTTLMVALALALLAARDFILKPASRARLRTAAPWIAWGAAWFVGATVPLAGVFPDWAPYRAVFASLGLGLAIVPFLAAARPALVGALVGVRVIALLAAPGPPPRVSAEGKPGVTLDFEKLVRLERYLEGIRTLLASRVPSLPHGALVGSHHRPLMTGYALGDDRFIQVWRHDSTLRWVSWEALQAHSDRELDAIVEYEPRAGRQFAMVEPKAMSAYLEGKGGMDPPGWEKALTALRRADSLQIDRDAMGFLGAIAGRRAVACLGLGRTSDAEREARRGLALWPEGGDARYALGTVLVFAGRLDEARPHVDTLLALHPGEGSTTALKEWLRQATPASGARGRP
jgi:hypothetical protein